MKKKRLLVAAIAAVLLITAVLGAACNLMKTEEGKTFTVTYKDGDEVLQSISVKSGENVGTAFAPEKEGYNFDGWFTDEDCTVPAENVSATDNVALYAKFSVKVFTVVFKDKDGSTLKTENVEYGKAATAPDAPELAGLTFSKWDKAFDSVKSNLTVTATYDQKQYALRFKINGQELYSVQIYAGKKGETLYPYATTALEEIILPSGYDFDCWVGEDGKSEAFTKFSNFVMPERDYTFNVKLKLAGLGAISAENQRYTYGDTAGATFEASFTEEPDAGISYAYAWYLGDVKVADGKTFTATGYAAGNHTFTVKVVASAEGMTSLETSATATLTVDNGTLTGFTANNSTVTYDAQAHGVTVNGTALGDEVKFSADKQSWHDALTYTAAGEYKIYYKVSRANYDDFISATPATLTIDKAALTVIAGNASIKYGAPLPSFTATFTGFIGTDDESVVSGSAAFTCTDSTKQIGNFDITPALGTLSAANYKFTVFTKGTLTISKAALTVTADDVSVTYGDDIPAYTATFTGFASGEDESVLSGTLAFDCAYVKGSNVNADGYIITPKGLTSDNYEIEYKTGVLSVGKKTASITAHNASVTYGNAADAWNVVTVGTDGLVSIDYRIDCDYTTISPVGTYDIVITLLNNSGSANYAITTTDATLTVNPRPITVSVSARTGFTGSVWTKSDWNITGTSTAGTAPDRLFGTLSTSSAAIATYTASGKTLGDDFVWSGLKITKGVDGNYDYIDCYDITYDLSVEIYDAAISHDASGYTGVYDGKAHSITLTCDLAGAVITYSTDGVNYAADKPSFKDAGTHTVYYKITADGKAPVSDSADVVISAAPLSVTANDETVTFGDDVSAYSVAYDGLVNGETAAVLSGTLAFDCTYAKGSPVNADGYAITPKGLTSDNYEITFVDGTVTVNPLAAAVVWNIGNGYTYNGADQSATVTATYKDIDNRDANASVAFDKNGVAKFITAGTYALTASTADANYTLTNATNEVVMGKGTYTDITTPAAITNKTYSAGITLGNISLPENYRWATPSTQIHCNGAVGNGYAALYNADVDNYEDFALTITVILKKASVDLAGDTVQGFDYLAGTTHSFDTSKLTNSAGVAGTYTVEAGKGSYEAAGTYAFTVSFDSQDYTGIVDCYMKVKGVKIGDTLYTIEDALKASASGNTVIVTADTAFASDSEIRANLYNGTDYYTVKSGVTLVLPSTQDSSTTVGTPTYGANEGSPAGTKSYVDNTASEINCVLTVPADITINTNGNIIIQGLLGTQGGPLEGHTSGNHSQMINDGTILVNNGAKLDVRGYIKGNGEVILNDKSTVYSPFVVRDFRGGTNTATVFKEGNISPFSQYEMPNIQCGYSLYSGAIYNAYMDLYASSKHNNTVMPIIGTSSGLLKLSTGARIIKDYNRTNTKTTLTIIGNVTLGDLSLTVMNTTVALSSVIFPIPWTYDVILGDDSTATTVTASNQFKLMPGASLTIAKNATLNLSGSLIVYSSFTDTAFGGCSYPNKPAAILSVNGTLNATGKFGGRILSSENGGKVIFGSSATLSMSSVEGNSGATTSTQAFLAGTILFGGEFVTIATISETATLVNADSTTITPTKNKTYTYNAGLWA